MEWLEVWVIAKERIFQQAQAARLAQQIQCLSRPSENREGPSRHVPYVMGMGISASPVGHFPLEPLSFGLIFLDFRDVVR